MSDRDAVMVTSNRADEVKMIKVEDGQWSIVECEDDTIKLVDEGKVECAYG